MTIFNPTIFYGPIYEPPNRRYIKRNVFMFRNITHKPYAQNIHKSQLISIRLSNSFIALQRV